ncbi:MAG: M28 family peptidase [Chloroflexi bacterium]|nr:M28 family peptidase [Chloroflexota bacterium]
MTVLELNWHEIDRFLIGEAWAGSQISQHVTELCDVIGPRWGGSNEDRRAAEYIHRQMELAGLDRAEIEPFKLDTWDHGAVTITMPDVDGGRTISSLPFLRCKPIDISTRLVDVGFASAHEVESAAGRIKDSIVLASIIPEPFTTAEPFTARLMRLSESGAACVVAIEPKTGGRMEYSNSDEWLNTGPQKNALAVVKTSSEDGAYLRRIASTSPTIRVSVDARYFDSQAYNTVAELTGETHPERHLILAGHHDTVLRAPGGNDNASGTIGVMETARVMAALVRELGVRPGMSIRFATWSGEEQHLQGSTAYVARHHAEDGDEREAAPLLNINLDELSTGHMKGVVLNFPHLRKFIQEQLDTMDDGLKCHVLAHMDAHSDHFPFARQAIDASILWRWRFWGRHETANFHHEMGDAANKLNVRELKEYAGQIARLLLRLSHVAPDDWPTNPLTLSDVNGMIERDAGRHHPAFH